MKDVLIPANGTFSFSLETASEHIISPSLIILCMQGNNIKTALLSQWRLVWKLSYSSACHCAKKSRHESLALKSHSVKGCTAECLILHISKIWPPMSCEPPSPLLQSAKHSHFWTFKSIPTYYLNPPQVWPSPRGHAHHRPLHHGGRGLWGSIISLTPAGQPGQPPLSLTVQNRVRAGRRTA